MIRYDEIGQSTFSTRTRRPNDHLRRLDYDLDAEIDVAPVLRQRILRELAQRLQVERVMT